MLHFQAGQLPPVAVFWNLGEAMLFVDNDPNRYSIGSTTDGLVWNPGQLADSPTAA